MSDSLAGDALPTDAGPSESLPIDARSKRGDGSEAQSEPQSEPQIGAEVSAGLDAGLNAEVGSGNGLGDEPGDGLGDEPGDELGDEPGERSTEVPAAELLNAKWREEQAKKAALLEAEAEVVVEQPPPTLLRCWGGAIVAVLFSLVTFMLVAKITANFAAHPLHSTNYIALRISAAVRTLLVGMFTLGGTVFGFVGLGLFALGVQVGLKRQSGEGS